MKKIIPIFLLLLAGVSAAKAQTFPPMEVRNFVISSYFLDTRQTAQEVTFTFETDVSSDAELTLNLNPLFAPNVKLVPYSMTRTANGAYQTKVLFPQNSPPDTWRVHSISASSPTAQTRLLYGSEIAAKGYPIYFDVFSTPQSDPKTRKRTRFL